MSRNAPCPCGSGRRYKACHGAVSPDGPGGAARARARAAILEDDLATARAACDEALSIQPGDPQALAILASCDQRAGNLGQALTRLLLAVESPDAAALPPAIQHAHWSTLNSFMGYALAGRGNACAQAHRVAYRAWLDDRRSASPNCTPIVSIILCVRDASVDWRAALASIEAQTYPDIELLVVMNRLASIPRETIDTEAVGNKPVACITVDTVELDRMIAAALPHVRGDYVNALDANHRFASERIAACVRNIAGAGAAWGFTGVSFTLGDSGETAPADHPQARHWYDVLSLVPEAYTAGLALIAQDCVAVDVSNLFLRRDLLQRLIADDATGAHPVNRLIAWEWCLASVMFDEPVRVEDPWYRHRLDAGVDPLQLDRVSFDRDVLRIFKAYYRRCEVTGGPRNPWAPSWNAWRWHFLKCVTRNAHIFALPFASLKAWAADLILAAELPQQAARPGITLVGFAYGEFGLGENLRALARACTGHGIPFSIRDVELHLHTRKSDFSMAAHVTDAIEHRFALFCLNPDVIQAVTHLIAQPPEAGRRNAGYWFWEMEHVPLPWMPLMDTVDEIWVATEFVRAAMQPATSRPVLIIPTPIDVRLTRPYARPEFGLTDGPFLFLFSFDFEPRPERKNPEGLVRAFKRAFPRDRRDVGLVLKSSNGGYQPARLAALHQLIDGDTRIVVLDRILARDAVYGLQSVADCYVSLHRSEGLGLGLAESMFQGKPVIGTRYSGNLDFMQEDNSGLVDCALIPVAPGDYIYDDARFRWADPDLDHAAFQMRRVVEDATWRNSIARKGQHDVRTRFSRAATALLIRARLEEVGAL